MAFLLSLALVLAFTFAIPLSATNTLTMEEKIGQMLVVGFRGYVIQAGSTIADDIQKRNVGGVVLFDKDMTAGESRNIENPVQLARLSKQVKTLSKSNPLVSIDHEGGYVCRLKEKYGFPKTMTALKMAGLDEGEFIAAADAMIATLVGNGINLSFAPVVDVNVNPESPAIGKWERSYSADPEVVIEKAKSFIERHRKQNVLTSLKHFPGHGSSASDSHLGLVDVTDTWQEYELKPFEALIRSGLADSVMTAHVFNRKLDPQYPATLSPTIIPDLLRKRMGFDGVVFSDDMQMGAITQLVGLEQAIQLALDADLDVLVFGNNVSFDEHIAEKVIDVIRGLVKNGTVSPERIERSYRRIQRMKERLASDE